MTSTWATIGLDWASDAVALVTLNRPEQANTINSQMSHDLADVVRAVTANDDARVLVVSGAGKRFCAGADLKEPDRPANFLQLARDAIDALGASRIVSIAAVNGTCMGGGLELALACDLRIAARTATLGLPEIRFGALPGAGGPQRLARLVGPAKAKRLILTGAPFDAETAHSLGVVDELAADAVERALELAAEIAPHAGYALRTLKASIDRGLDRPLPEALAAEYRAIDSMATPGEATAEIAKAMQRSATYSKIFAGDGQKETA